MIDKSGIIRKRNNILGQVKKYIDNNLNPNSKSFFNDLPIQETLSSMGITEDDSYWALSISPDNDYDIHLKTSTGSCIVNSYNPVLVKAWEANVYIQSVDNCFKALTCMTAYFPKPKSEASESLKQAVKEIKKIKLKCESCNEKNCIFIYKFMPTFSTSTLGYVLQESLSLIQICLTMELG